MRQSLVVLVFLAGVLAGSVLCFGQQDPPPANAPAAEASDELAGNGVYIATSDEASQRIRWARNLARAEQWDQAAQVLHEAYTRYGNRLLARPDGLNVGVGEIVMQMLADWPAEGLAVYRRRYDGVARSAYERAAGTGDGIEMAAVARQYWASSIGPRAADEAAEMALESGRFTAAIELWSRLLAHLPRLGNEKSALPPLLAKLAVAHTWNNQPALAKKYRDRLVKEFADWPNSFSGSSGTLLAWVDAHASAPLIRDGQAASAGHSPILGGGPDRNAIPSATLNFGARIWEFAEHKTNIQQQNDPRFGSAQPQVVRPGGRQPMPGFLLHPVLVDGVLYFSAPGGVYALPATSGRPKLWHNTTVRGTPTGVQRNLAPPHIYSPTYWQGRLYVDYGSPTVRMYYGGDTGGGGSGIACLDAATGSELWRLEIDSISGLQRGYLDASPVVVAGRVYMVVHVAQFFDTVTLVAADANTGKLIWQQQISSADSGSGYYSTRATVSLPAVDGNTVYMATNLGTITAVSAETGQIRWIRQYLRNNRMLGDRFTPQPQNAPPAEFSPTIAWNDKVVVAPTDCDDLMILDGQTGEILVRLNKKRQLFEMSELYGIVGDTLIGRGRQVFAWDLGRNKLAWSITPDWPVTYRGQLSREYLYLPTDKYLLRLDLANKGRQEQFPWQAAGENRGYDGTIVLHENMIITANAERICGYCEWDLAERMAIAAIDKAAPEKQPDRILDYAGYAYMNRKLGLAQAQLVRAVEAAGGFDRLTRVDLKNRVFVNALEFAEEAWKDDPKATLELLEMASMCPPDVPGHVRYRMALARYWEDNKRPAQAVHYYQEVLADPEMRAAPHYLGEEDRVEGGRFAREKIDTLIAAHGPNIYDEVNQRAERDYAQAAERNDWPLVQRLVLQYPNAPRTLEELFRLADYQAGRSNFEDAISWLRYLRREYTFVLSQRPQLDARALTTMAGYALRLRDRWLASGAEQERVRQRYADRALVQAYEFVHRGSKLSGEHRVTIDGIEGPFAEHRARMQEVHGRKLQMLPMVSSPLRVATSPALPPNSRLLKATLGSGPSNSNDDIVLTASQTGVAWELRGYRPGQSAEPLWARKYDQQRGTPLNLITYFEDSAVLLQSNRIEAINPETGERAWTAELAGERQTGQIRFFARHENFLFVAGQTSCMIIDMESGAVVSQFRLPDMLANQPILAEDTLVCLVRNPQPGIAVIDWRTGKLTSRIQVPADTMNLTVVDQTVVAFSRTSVVGHDLKSGKELWKQAANNMTGAMPAMIQSRQNMLYHMERSATGWQVVATDVTTGKNPWRQRLSSAEQARFVSGQGRLILQDDELIAFADNAMAVLDAEKGEISYVPFLDPAEFIRDMLVTQDYLVAVVGPNPQMAFRGGRNAQQVEVRLYDRTPGGGRLEQKIPVTIEGYGQPSIVPANPGLVVQGQSMPKMTVLSPQAEQPPKK